LYTHKSGHSWGDDGDVIIEEEIWSFFSKMSLNNSTGLYHNSKDRELIKVFDILGRKSIERKNAFLFYIYDDGTVEKRIIIE
jgi:hypothetical protein